MRGLFSQRRIAIGPVVNPLARHTLGRLPWVFLLLFAAGCTSGTTPNTGTTPEPVRDVPSDKPATIQTKSGVEMALIPAGQFMMGGENGEDDEKPARQVQVSAFYMDVTEVTQESFQAMLGRNPAKWPGPDKPVERVSWLAAVQYCNMRSTRDSFRPCYDLKTLKCDFTADGYRLPTEAEWEYACRAGTSTPWSFGSAAGDVGKYAWFKGNSGKTTHPVKGKPANPWGLYDMHGNVAEWCHDFYDERYYASAPAQDPRGPEAGEERVLRGGSWNVGEGSCRSAARFSQPPGLADVCFGYEAYGFRCVRRADK